MLSCALLADSPTPLSPHPLLSACLAVIFSASEWDVDFYEDLARSFDLRTIFFSRAQEMMEPSLLEAVWIESIFY